jgi:hypothetical protein
MFPVNSVFRLALLGLRCSGLIVPPQNIETGIGFHDSLFYLRFCPLQTSVSFDKILCVDPRDDTKLLEPVPGGRADVVYGPRVSGGPDPVLFFWHEECVK